MTDITAIRATIADITTLRAQLPAVAAAASGGSNDREIAALRDATETALTLQGLSFSDDEGTGIRGLIADAKTAAAGDSNDREIEAYQDLLSEALRALGLDDDGNVISVSDAEPTTPANPEQAAGTKLSDFTVIGAWLNGDPVPVGVIPGDHPVSGGDESAFSEGIWGLAVRAENASDAETVAVHEMETEGGES